MSSSKDNPCKDLLPPLPEERLHAWLEEFYGKPVQIAKREILRHCDFSCMERLSFREALPESLIYKLVLPPLEIEQDLHERILIPSIASSAQLYMSAHYGRMTAMFLEDLGSSYLSDGASQKRARQFGEELARLHRAYSYRIDELIAMNVLRSVTPIDFATLTLELEESLAQCGHPAADGLLSRCAARVAGKLAGEPVTLVHGDLYGDNIVCGNRRHFIVNWSWPTIIGVPLVDLVTVTADHEKNGKLRPFADELLEAYCFEYGRKTEDVRALLPFARVLERILYLMWLVERHKRDSDTAGIGAIVEETSRLACALVG